jgi:hypothetical protein
LWGKAQSLSPAEVDAALVGSAADKILVLGQCHAGTFGALRAPRTVACCACGATEASFPRPGNAPPYDEFLYQLAGALAGAYPDGQPLPPDQPLPVRPISIGAAFRFAMANDCWVTGTRAFTETPCLFDPAGLAEQLTL